MKKVLGFILIFTVLFFQISYNKRLESYFFPCSPIDLVIDVSSIFLIFLGFLLLKNKKVL
jgi:hypothetical protein